MKQKKLRVLGFSAIFCSLLLSSCSNSSSAGGTASPAPASSTSGADVQPQPPAAEVDPCSMFSAADAQAIMGVPMTLSPGHGAIVCMYLESSPKPGEDTARVSLALSVHKSAEEEARVWNNIKVIRSLRPGEKNISQLSGIGDEAWFDGHIEKGKLGTGGVLARKGKSDFKLESAVFAYRASPDVLKSIAKRIADQLQ